MTDQKTEMKVTTFLWIKKYESKREMGIVSIQFNGLLQSSIALFLPERNYLFMTSGILVTRNKL